jgi:hypothetical protein
LWGTEQLPVADEADAAVMKVGPRNRWPRGSVKGVELVTMFHPRPAPVMSVVASATVVVVLESRPVSVRWSRLMDSGESRCKLPQPQGEAWGELTLIGLGAAGSRIGRGG